jgi:hypothetical protein
MSTNQEVLPQPEVSPSPAGGEEQLGNSVEVPAPKEKDTRHPASMVTLSQDLPTTIPATSVVPGDPSSSSVPIQDGATGGIADDVDLIEKEWVDKAKAIVEATQDDPRKQKSEISKVKAEYIQKRFNKTIKVDSAA